MFTLTTILLLSPLPLSVVALPHPDANATRALVPRAVATMSAPQLNAYTPYTQFARAAYCDSSTLKDWSCGKACEANPDFQVNTAGGNGNSIQNYFVGYWPSKNTVVVAHEGTDPTAFESVLTDVKLLQRSLDSTLFPGAPSSVTVHDGFANEHALTATAILAAVKNLLSSHSSAGVVVIGHSLGGALAELDALYLTLNLPSGTKISGVTYGTPRVGNAAWSTYFDSQVTNFTRVNNRDDFIPILPGRSLGYEHVAQEVHILGTDSAIVCPGAEDTTDAQCTTSAVPNIFEGNILDHLGPYQGVWIGTIFCT
ncbi:alpha/beta-hydrolase [Vararia minispora EC-137]|uniref:Alpha/beta-hydrolase n=1 Tax=Vararia minispora EC-137 TaxID=1314806 RepID=A0ACB8QLP7_9AGAM|nr:alpha/beta-hydrolase [Vararia minispora EC-137]